VAHIQAIEQEVHVHAPQLHPPRAAIWWAIFSSFEFKEMFSFKHLLNIQVFIDPKMFIKFKERYYCFVCF
jgi:hypothetical protein